MAHIDPLPERIKQVRDHHERPRGNQHLRDARGLRDHRPSGGVRMSTPPLSPARERS
jgi:hypothetical protein